MVKLEGSIKRFIGLSSDTKPEREGADSFGNPTGAMLPPGSSFFETDTFRIARWNGIQWTYEAEDTRITDRLDTLIAEIRELKAVHLEFFAKV